MPLKLNIIGCGRVGKTLAFLLKKNNVVCIQDIYNPSLISAKNAVHFITSGQACHTLNQFRCAELYLIGTPDDRIEMACKQLIAQAPPPSGSVVFHCSGALSSHALHACEALGCYTASMHPLFSFADPLLSVKHFSGTYCVLEGRQRALQRVAPLISGIGGQCVVLEKTAKLLYHAATVFSSNYVVTLAAIAEECYRRAGLPPDLSKAFNNALMQQTLHNLTTLKVSEALTGPIQRGDKKTLEKHRQALKPFPALEQIYKNLGQLTVPLTTLPFELKKILQRLFE